MSNKKIIYVDGEETNYLVSSDGKIFNRNTNKELRGTISGYEYRTVQLTINGKPKCFQVHRLVAQAFIENPNNLPVVDHIDRNKLNNDYTNLRWVTSVENAANSSPRRKIKTIQYKEITFDCKPLLEDKRYYAHPDGYIINSNTLRVLSGTERNGYIRITIGNSRYSAHVLIWEAFNGKKPEGMVIDHIDGNHANNKLSNLRLVTQSENMSHSYELNHSGKVGLKQYDSDGKFIAHYDSIREAAQAINGNEYAIKQASDRYGKSAGYFWLRDSDSLTIEEVLKITKSGKPKSSYVGVSQYDLNKNFIAHYESFAKAAKAVGCSGSTISRAAAAKRATQGFYWITDNSNFDINDF